MTLTLQDIGIGASANDGSGDTPRVAGTKINANNAAIIAYLNAMVADFLTPADAAEAYQPLDGDLTAIAALTTTSFGRGLLTKADASAVRSTLGILTSLSIAGGTVTSSTPVLDATQTWNSGGVTFTGLKFNVTNTASAAASLLIDLQVAGTSRFKVDAANGDVTVGRNIAATNISLTFDAIANRDVYSGFGGFGRVFVGGTDVILARDAANTLALRNGTNAQTFRVYGTYTDGSNYERAYLSKGAGPGGLTTLGTEKAGTGSAGNIAIIADGTSIFHCGSFGSGFMSMYTNITGASAGVYDLGAGSIGGAFRRLHLTEFIETIEMTAPSAPSANGVRIYATDNGSGKTVLYALFASGSAQQLAIEP